MTSWWIQGPKEGLLLTRIRQCHLESLHTASSFKPCRSWGHCSGHGCSKLSSVAYSLLIRRAAITTPRRSAQHELILTVSHAVAHWRSTPRSDVLLCLSSRLQFAMTIFQSYCGVDMGTEVRTDQCKGLELCLRTLTLYEKDHRGRDDTHDLETQG
jgi:hypothetical protein